MTKFIEAEHKSVVIARQPDNKNDNTNAAIAKENVQNNHSNTKLVNRKSPEQNITLLKQPIVQSQNDELQKKSVITQQQIQPQNSNVLHHKRSHSDVQKMQQKGASISPFFQ